MDHKSKKKTMKETNEDKSWELISKHLGNELNEEERNELNRWLEEDLRNRKEMEYAQKIWEISNQKDFNNFNTDEGWNKMHRRIHQSSLKITGSTKKIYVTLFRAAAALLVLFALAYLIVFMIGKTDYTTVIASSRMIDNPVILADGTKVYLNIGANLSYPKNFKLNTRTVKLTGEAFFDVARNEKQPFIIKTPAANIQVLGTSFNVLACTKCDSVQVSVKTGIVELSSMQGTNKLIITKGNTGVYHINPDQLKLAATDINMNCFAWKTDSIIFQDSHLAIVTQTLERIFNEKIIVKEEKIKNCPITADFKEHDLSKILESISISHGLKVNKTNNGYILTGTECK